MKELTIKSPVFEANQQIPKKYGGDEEDINPPLTIDGIPPGAKSLALIMDDPDAPRGTFVHWVVWNIPSSIKNVAEHTAPGTEGTNSLRSHGYTGPAPPPGTTHRYFFKVYALDQTLDLGTDTAKRDLERAMQGHVLAEGQLMGKFSG